MKINFKLLIYILFYFLYRGEMSDIFSKIKSQNDYNDNNKRDFFLEKNNRIANNIYKTYSDYKTEATWDTKN